MLQVIHRDLVKEEEGVREEGTVFIVVLYSFAVLIKYADVLNSDVYL